MQTYYGFDNISLGRPAVVSVGSFDGVHRGHQELISRVRSMASECDALSVVVSFEPHPRIAMGRAEGMQLLTTLKERELVLERMGVDVFVVVHFDDRFREQTFDEFVRGSLVAKLGMCGMVVGYNHRLGRGSEGSYETLLPLSEELGFRLERVEQFLAEGDKDSSTVVRDLFEKNDVGRACELLGHSYIVVGEACNGRLLVESSYKLIPADGVYSVNIVGHGQQDIAVRDSQIIIDNALCGELIIEF